MPLIVSILEIQRDLMMPSNALKVSGFWETGPRCISFKRKAEQVYRDERETYQLWQPFHGESYLEKKKKKKIASWVSKFPRIEPSVNVIYFANRDFPDFNSNRCMLISRSVKKCALCLLAHFAETSGEKYSFSFLPKNTNRPKENLGACPELSGHVSGLQPLLS